ncbi:MAG TPA: sugar phosphate isomerase/epimerase family protein, partial [Candidatus Glassbacteria bacterium]|nr:sugar phosphate isomerase/epimerase family protein [Candidatus Glassbacteria bacterium]
PAMSGPAPAAAAARPKVALCTIAFQDRPLDEVLKLAAEVGFDGVEPWGKPDHLPLTRTDDEVKAVADRIAELGLKTSHYGSYVRLGDSQAPAEKDRDMQRAVDITRLLGANICRMWAGLKDSELLGEDDWKLMVDDGQRFCARAEAAGVTLAIEMHGNSVTNKAAAALDLIDRVGSPALRLNYQILNNSEDPYERARIAGPYVVMVHAQNENPDARGQALICGGAVDFKKVWEILHGQFGFAGYFEVEFVRGETTDEKVAALKADYECLRSIA